MQLQFFRKDEKQLEDLPFSFEFKYENSASCKSYWTYDRMMLQNDDFIEVINMLHGFLLS